MGRHPKRYIIRYRLTMDNITRHEFDRCSAYLPLSITVMIEEAREPLFLSLAEAQIFAKQQNAEIAKALISSKEFANKLHAFMLDPECKHYKVSMGRFLMCIANGLLYPQMLRY